MISLNHGWDKFFGEPVVSESIDIKREPNILLSGIKNTFASCYAGIVDKDRGLANFCTNLRCDFGNGCWRSDIALVVENI